MEISTIEKIKICNKKIQLSHRKSMKVISYYNDICITLPKHQNMLNLK